MSDLLSTYLMRKIYAKMQRPAAKNRLISNYQQTQLSPLNVLPFPVKTKNLAVITQTPQNKSHIPIK
jgi:hypothetical protein